MLSPFLTDIKDFVHSLNNQHCVHMFIQVFSDSRSIFSSNEVSEKSLFSSFRLYRNHHYLYGTKNCECNSSQMFSHSHLKLKQD